MKLRIKLWGIAVLTCSSCVSADDSARQNQLGNDICNTEIVGDLFPNTSQYPDNSMLKNSIQVSPEVGSELVQKYCQNALSIAKVQGISPIEIDRVAITSLDKYVMRTVNTKDMGQTLGAIIRAELGVAGFARPTVKVYGALSISNVVNFDSIRIRGHLYLPAVNYLLHPGTAVVEGIRENEIVCNGTVEILASANIAFECDLSKGIKGAANNE